MPIALFNEDCLTHLDTLSEDSIDACVTDPPYGLSQIPPKTVFKALEAWIGGNPYTKTPASTMGLSWDAFVPGPEVWSKVHRVLKPGSYACVFSSPRTSDLMSISLRLSGFELLNTIMWLNLQGFPKSLNRPNGLGTALKPAYEAILLVRKPLAGTYDENLKAYGTGFLNIDQCRIGDKGYWPPNLLTSHHPDCIYRGEEGGLGLWDCVPECPVVEMVEGSGAFRHAIPTFKAPFFYSPKVSKAERDLGCSELEKKTASEITKRKPGSKGLNSPRAGAGRTSGSRNHHPTIKPIALMRYLVRLITPTEGTVLDPFVGSGTAGIACVLENRGFIGVEKEQEYYEIAKARIGYFEDQVS